MQTQTRHLQSALNRTPLREHRVPTVPPPCGRPGDGHGTESPVSKGLGKRKMVKCKHRAMERPETDLRT